MLDERYKSTQKPAGAERSLPLEGGAPRSESKIYMTAGGSHTSTTVVRLKPGRMRSKVTALYRPMVMIGSFDLISRNESRASFPSRGSLSSEVRGCFLRVKALSCLQRVARRKP